jgi:orotidine-5'-phosphate decarboxylase
VQRHDDRHPHKRIILALDVDSIEKADELVGELSEYVGYFKIGLEFIHVMLNALINDRGSHITCQRLLRELSGRIMWDGKFHDIPNTVGGATRATSRQLEAHMLTIHASGGIEMIRAAVANKGKMLVLGVTVLTSIKDRPANEAQHVAGTEYCSDIYSAQSDNRVAYFAQRLIEAGADGIVCAPRDLDALARTLKGDFKKLLKVVPGTRSDGVPTHDQARPETPRYAILHGADYLVIGRQITGATNRFSAAERLAEEIGEAALERARLEDDDTDRAPPVHLK